MPSDLPLLHASRQANTWRSLPPILRQTMRWTKGKENDSGKGTRTPKTGSGGNRRRMSSISACPCPHSVAPTTKPALSGSNPFPQMDTTASTQTSSTERNIIPWPPLAGFLPQLDTTAPTQTFGAERNIIPWPTLDEFPMESTTSGLQPPPLRLHSSTLSVTTLSPEGLAMSFVTFGSDSECVPSVASPESFFGIHASPNNYGQVVNGDIDDPFHCGGPFGSHDASDDDFASEVDDTFSFLGRPRTRADANLLWTHDLRASRCGSLGGSATVRLDRPVRAKTLIGPNESLPRPNSSSSDHDVDTERAGPPNSDDDEATSGFLATQRSEDVRTSNKGRSLFGGSPLRVATASGNLRSAVQAIDRVLWSHTRHSPAPIPISPPGPALVSFQRGNWLQHRQRVTSSERRTTLGWKRRISSVPNRHRLG
ncbi:hypothetical protein B0H10DRAFT_2130169 [Mycena sp. CBHHK59/15]|nr:hypothetical protein B0H10DRAFT_2156625 [Mycena sp. CBHHK59/15]KAJ6548078.1 hypothetical protein B0H10DRAFT_2130169 [Mycena sp. CBHHK59/15]